MGEGDMTCGVYSNVGFELNALFSADVYDNVSGLDPDGVWSRLTDSGEKPNGFFGAAYKNKDTVEGGG